MTCTVQGETAKVKTCMNMLGRGQKPILHQHQLQLQTTSLYVCWAGRQSHRSWKLWIQCNGGRSDQPAAEQCSFNIDNGRQDRWLIYHTWLMQLSGRALMTVIAGLQGIQDQMSNAEETATESQQARMETLQWHPGSRHAASD